MLRHLLFLAILLLVSCGQSGTREEKISISAAPKQNSTTSQAEPDPYFLRARLFRFFEGNKHLWAFDTSDETIRNYWGIVNHPSSAVEAGHLFNRNQTHAIIYYSDEAAAGMFIYLKKEQEWKDIRRYSYNFLRPARSGI
jgi:hypothetical protein